MPRRRTSKKVRFLKKLIFLGKVLLVIAISIYIAIIFIINCKRMSVPIAVPFDNEMSDSSPPSDFVGIFIYLMFVYTLYERTKAKSSFDVDNPWFEIIQHPCFSRRRIFGDSGSINSGYSIESIIESIVEQMNCSDDDYDYGYDADVDENEDGADVDTDVDAIDIDEIVSSEEDSCCVDSYPSYTSNDDTNNDNLRFSAYKPEMKKNAKHNNSNSASNIANIDTLTTFTTSASSIATTTIASNTNTSCQTTDDDVPYTYFYCGYHNVVVDPTPSQSSFVVDLTAAESTI